MTDEANPLGTRVRARRLQLGLSQGDLSGPGLSASYLSLIEAGKREPTPATLGLIADGLRCSVAFLRDGSDDERVRLWELEVAWAEIALVNGEASEALARARDLPGDGVPSALRWRGDMVVAQALELVGDLEAAIAAFQRLREKADADPRRYPALPVTVALCRCYREAGDLTYSIETAEAALAQARADDRPFDDDYAELAATLIAGYYERGDLVHAAYLAGDLLERVEGSGTHAARAAALWNASVVAQERGQVGEALRMAESAMGLLAESDRTRNLARLRVMHAGLLLRADMPEPAKALEALQAAVPVLEQVGSAVDLAYADTEMARAALLTGEPQAAAEAAERALSRLGQEPRLERAHALTILADALIDLGRREEAAARARHAAQLLDLAGGGRGAAAAWTALAENLLALGESAEAATAYRRALAAAGVPGSPRRTAAFGTDDGSPMRPGSSSG